MNRVFLSGISAIAGGAIVHITEKETMNQLKGKNDEYKRLINRLINELNRKNLKIRELEKKVNKEKEDSVEKGETNNIDVKQTLNLEIDSSDTSDSFDSFEEFDQKKEDSFPGAEAEAESRTDSETLLEEAESSIEPSIESSKSESKSESVEMSSSVSFG